MALSLLIVTPQNSFGEYIRQSLKDKYPLHAVVVDNIHAAVEEFMHQNFTHAFLDMDLEGQAVLELGLTLRKMDPGLSLVIIASEQRKPRLDVLRPWNFLPKPFYLPDLFSLFDTDFPALDKSVEPETDEGLNWLQDVSKAAQHLTRLTLESSAQAALLIRKNKLWAYSGQLSSEASAELVETVSRDKKIGDLLKFIRLKSTEAEHMLYATQLAEGVNLAMVFDAETPFSTIRRQATRLAESLALTPSEDIKKENTRSDKINEDEEELQALFDFDEAGEDLPPISDILDNIPAPNPISAASEAKTSVPISPSDNQRPAVFDEPMPSLFSHERSSALVQHSQNYTLESSPAIHFDETRPSDVAVKETRPQLAQPREEVDLAATRVSTPMPRPNTPLLINRDVDLAATRASESEKRPQTPVRVPKPEELVETRPHSITEVAGRVLVEPSSRGMYDLTYACLLLPRFDTHHLTGDLAERLSEWMPKIGVAFGWRLEYISVRPDYLQWVINVPPTTSPGYLMRIIRKQTSSRIFDDFPRLREENPSGDFWAPGYLIMGGSQPHPSKLVRDYIKRTRERQGML